MLQKKKLSENLFSDSFFSISEIINAKLVEAAGIEPASKGCDQ